jgi:hypothetical protein
VLVALDDQINGEPVEQRSQRGPHAAVRGVRAAGGVGAVVGEGDDEVDGRIAAQLGEPPGQPAQLRACAVTDVGRISWERSLASRLRIPTLP